MESTQEILDETVNFDLPAAGTRCTDVLSDTLQGFAGIHAAEFDVQQGHLLVDYNPQILSDERALQLVRKAGERAYGRVQHCALKAERGETACAACVAELGRELARHYRAVSQVTSPVKTGFSAGNMQFNLLSSTPAFGETAQAEAFPVSTPEVTAPRPRLGREQLEIFLTIVTAIAALLAYLGGAFYFIPSAGTTFLYAVAFLAGGYYGFLDGLAILHDRRLDVNLLMIFAALGAAVIGQPAEGAALLFLFSLSNTLQSYAMDRSRQAIEKLLDLRPATATVRRGSRLVSLPIEKLLLGDIVLVRPGERFPIDGEVIAGNSSADQSTITGE